MERALAGQGYLTLNLDYPARRQALADLARGVHEPIERFSARVDGRLHFVTHSMGGLVARAYLARHRPARLGRVVMLGPPNSGSEVADLLERNRFYRAYFGPAGSELVTPKTDALAAVLGRIDYPVGVIAGDRSINLISSLLVIPRPNDGKVSVAATHVEGEADHITLHTTHPMMMFNREVIRQTLHFLREGSFA
ncbi:hypothetical protein GCM10007276_15890 [Agaricicola taiwanensis]|uniref:AB hydrolase-1 domain-containing protein n=2 Tax=Agaricicola taiwanensis TaxID=591372 RepID=A0A8J2YEY3_9RHOB|nr:hypothetical protein GCM10007276_15890 [Agaricicola taiwanensis]